MSLLPNNSITFPVAQSPSQPPETTNTLVSSQVNQLDIHSPETSPRVETGTDRSKSKKITVLASTIALTTLVAIAVVNQPSKPPEPSVPLPQQPSSPKSLPAPSLTQPLATAAKNERAGFQAILDGDLTKARSYFGYAYKAAPIDYNVDEIYNQLLSVEKVKDYNSKSQSQKQVILKQVFREIVNKYSWGAPDDILSQMKTRLDN